jgi:hypothetical protein
MSFARPFKLLACLSLAVGAAQGAHAMPITYQFTTEAFGTSPSIATGPSGTAITAALNGLSVSGTFVYDSDSPLTSITDGVPVVGEHNYEDNPISNFSASVGTFNFTGATGKADVADEGYVSRAFPNADPVYGDFLHFVSITDKGISLLGLPLATARLFWIESADPLNPTPDFLTSGDLPDVLPTLSGRFALDFVNKDEAGNVLGLTTAFFYGLTVSPAPVAPTPVPEPDLWALLLLAALALIPFARRRVKSPDSAAGFLRGYLPLSIANNPARVPFSKAAA